MADDPTNPDNHPHWKLGMLQLDMIRTAFACDLVRVATFMWSAGTNWVVFPGTFNGQAIMGSPQSSPHHPPSHTTDMNTMAWLAQIDTWYATRTSEALQKFNTMLDVDGNSLLDNTVVAYVSEVGRAYDHDQRNVPFLRLRRQEHQDPGGPVPEDRLRTSAGAGRAEQQSPHQRRLAGAGADLRDQRHDVAGQPDAVFRTAAWIRQRLIGLSCSEPSEGSEPPSGSHAPGHW